MNEVSCRALSIHFDCARKHGLALDEYVKGLTYTLTELETPNNWVDWETYRELTRRLTPLCPTPAHWREMGREFVHSIQVIELNSVFRILASPRLIAKWAFKFGGFRLFKNMTAEVREENGTLITRLGIKEPYAVCPEYFYVCSGFFTANPTVVGFPEVPVEVELEAGERYCTFRSHYEVIEPRGWRGSALRSWSKALWQSVAPRRQLVAQFEKNQLLLEDRYERLQVAKDRIEAQQRALQLVHEVATATHLNLHLSQTMAAAAEQIRVRLKYEVVRISIDRKQAEGAVFHEEIVGDPALLDMGAHTEFLRVGDSPLGTVTVNRKSGPPVGAELELLRSVLEAIGLALNNAIAYEVIGSYRRDLEQKVKDRTTELEAARDHIQRTLDSRNRFFANINHELRTPLSILLLAVDRVSGDVSLSEDARSQVEVLQSNLSRLKDLVDELLLLAAGNEVKRTLRLTEIGAGRVLTNLVESLRPLANQRGLQLSARLEPSLLFDGDTRLIERAIANLLTNAIKYTDQGEVTLTAVRDGADVVISVKDTGPGIPPEYVPRLFERFFQVPFAASRPGAGIGLAMVKEIAEQHGGQALVHSVAGKGSTFTLRIPLRASDEIRARSVASVITDKTPTPRPPRVGTPVAASTPPVAAARTSHRILLVEDNVDLLAQLASSFSAQGWAVDKATNAEDGLKRAQSHPPDLLITDLDLGAGMNGLQMVKEFTQLKEHRHAPAIVLTANVEVGASAAFEGGALEFLEKPVNSAELVARVGALLAYRDLQRKLMATERLAAQGAALAGLSHELRNPLNGLVNAIEPLRAMLPEEAVAPGTSASELLAVIEECGDRVATLATELLQLTRTDSTQFEVRPLKDVIERALRACSQKLRPVQLKKELGFDGHIECSSMQLSQVLINLLENAVDAAGTGGWVMIKTAEREGRMVLEVRDSGPGVPSAIGDKVFEPFFTTKAAGQGTGLGLAIARDIARRHGGDLELIREGAFGLKLWLPAVAAVTGLSAQPRAGAA